MTNIHHVAKEAGVSVATVSRVLNGQNSVTYKTKLKVEEAINKLNYEPSVLGRNLRNSESRILLILIPQISNPFYTEIIKGIEQTAISLHYNILLCETDSNPQRENIYFELVRNKMADGIISMDPAVNHLIQIGHRNIAMINSDETYLYAQQRRQGYQNALVKHDIPIRPEYVLHASELGFDNGQQAMKSILKLKDRPTAVFAVSDLLAIGALKEVNNQQLQVPEDMAIVGFDKIDFSNMTYPTLTTISQPMYRMGKIAASMLIDRIKGKQVESIILEHELVIRGSTAG
ncbi:HTH-type transcriptional repressor CytR [Oceanobacillus picturae]|uniref:HTH-type transcriptional repressor CytR n=1 Tax=Oceanobacillus picturae TaxID=171693 RepID=W9AGP0_9BACI|nr:LacI family DNA-binding transcriptional regulator [Oceanobacillus picturae]CDO04628.1 HTH-type transcriptional repressor CytR [Oceanobacillus picturae]